MLQNPLLFHQNIPKSQMLVELKKDELEYIVTALWKCRKSEIKCEELYEKMKPLLDVCTCKEDSQ